LALTIFTGVSGTFCIMLRLPVGTRVQPAVLGESWRGVISAQWLLDENSVTTELLSSVSNKKPA
jgi:hypothetical protein